MEIEGIVKFTKLIHDFQKVERALHVPGVDRMENDVEHSYQLALVGWYAVTVNTLPLDVNKVIKYALLHDLVEVYAGDTDATDPNPEVHASKAAREHEALLQLRTELTEFPELLEMIESYERRQDDESMFVYSLDKILPPLNAYLDSGRAWKIRGLTLQEVIDHASKRVSGHNEVKKYFEQLAEILENEQHLFHQDDQSGSN